MFLFKSPENGSYVEIDLVEKYLLFSTPAFREAGEGACPGQFGDAGCSCTGFSLGSLLPVPSVLGTMRKVDGLKRLCVRSA